MLWAPPGGACVQRRPRPAPSAAGCPCWTPLPGESLQFKLELLPEVARAYVHLDWETTHAPEH